MKSVVMNRKYAYALPLFLASVFIGCSDNEEAGIDQLSEQARSFLSMRLNLVAQFETAATTLINRSFNAVSGNPSPGGDSDSTLIDEPWIGETCAVITEIENSDGSTTIIRDYGNGCQEGQHGFEYWMFGKVTETFRYIHNITGTRYRNEYLSRVNYEQYGGRYSDDYTWLINGAANYNGWSEWDTVAQKFYGSFTESSDLVSKYGDWEYSYSSEGVSHYDDTHWEQAAGGFYQYAEGDGYYRSDILRKLVMRFDCPHDDSMGLMVFGLTYVSGLEKITYRQDGKTGEFIIDYGNGECDNVIYILENGKRIRIEMDVLLTILSGG